MRIRRPGWLWTAILGGTIAGVVGIALGLLIMAEGSESVRNRDRLAICVQSVGFSGSESASMDAEAKSAVELALVEVVKHPLWAVRAANEPPPIAEIDCSAQPALYRTDVDEARTFFEVVGRPVASPSYFEVVVFVLPSAEHARMLVYEAFRLTTEEVLFSGDNCRGVTTGLYLSPEDLGDTLLIADNLEKAIGLEKPF